MDDSNEMIGLGHAAKRTSLAVYKHGNLALVPHYTNSGDYGYFIVEEHPIRIADKMGFLYRNQRFFIKKIDETAFQKALSKLKEIVLAEKQ